MTSTDVHDIVGLSSEAEAHYRMNRYYLKLPNATGVQLFINQTLLQEVTLTEGVAHVSKFSEYRDNVAEKGGLDSVPPMKSEDRTLFMRSGVPFLVTNAGEVESQYGLSIVYSIQVDTASPEYEKMGRTLDIQPEYSLWVKATQGRKNQRRDLLDNAIAKKEKLVLVKPTEGGAWDFDLYGEDVFAD